MQAIRFSLPLFALIGSITLYWILHQTIVLSGVKKLSSSSMGDINFIRVLNESKVEKKERVKKELPKQQQIKPPPKVSTNIAQKPVMTQTKLNIDIPPINMPVNIQNSGFLKGAVLTGNIAANSEAIAILRIPPIYPRRAKMLKKQGFVKLRLFISKDGLVSKAQVLESKPKNLFDKAALNSVYGWKFKPKIVDGKAVEQVAQQVVEFKLR